MLGNRSCVQLIAEVLACLLGMLSVRGVPFVMVNRTDASFRLDNEARDVYRSLGASLYPYWAGTAQDFPRRLMLHGKANGLSSFRAVLIFESVRGLEEAQLFSEAVWRPIDALLYHANRMDNVHVTLELSGLANWLEFGKRDPYTPSNHYLWDQLVDFATARVNRFSGVAYRDDAALFAYSVLGEILPSPRSVQANQIALLRRVSTRLKGKDPRHLVGSGGLLHMSPFSGYNDPVPYWQAIYGHVDVDFCMLHVYQAPERVFYSSTTNNNVRPNEWTQLSVYTKFCADRGKPFVIDEFGLNWDGYDRATGVRYFSYAFDAAYKTSPPVSVFQMWNWAPGGTFDTFPNEDQLLMQVLRQNSLRWGFNSGFRTLRAEPHAAFRMNGGAPVPPEILLLNDFESDRELGTLSGTSAFRLSTARSSTGKQSLEVDWRFTSTAYAVQTVTFRPLTAAARDWSRFATRFGILTCFAFIEADAPQRPVGYDIQLQIQGGGGRVYAQTMKAIFSNFLMVNRWNRVSMRLDPATSGEEFGLSSAQRSTWISELSNLRSWSISLVHPTGIAPMSGALWVDSCSVEIRDIVSEETLVPEWECDGVDDGELSATALRKRDGTTVGVPIFPADPSAVINDLYTYGFCFGILLHLAGILLILWGTCRIRKRRKSNRKLALPSESALESAATLPIEHLDDEKNIYQ